MEVEGGQARDESIGKHECEEFLLRCCGLRRTTEEEVNLLWLWKEEWRKSM